MIQFNIAAAADKEPRIHLADSADQLSALNLSPEESSYITEAQTREQNTIIINRYTELHLIYILKPKSSDAATHDSIRKSGAEASGLLKGLKAKSVNITSYSANSEAPALFA